MDLPISIRPFIEDDVNFIFHSWIETAKEYSSIGRNMRKSIFIKECRHLIQKILNRADGLMAFNAEDPTQIFGYLIYENDSDKIPLLHFIYVKGLFRNMGIARKLMESADIHPKTSFFYTQLTTYTDEFLKDFESKYNYDPYLVLA